MVQIFCPVKGKPDQSVALGGICLPTGEKRRQDGALHVSELPPNRGVREKVCRRQKRGPAKKGVIFMYTLQDDVFQGHRPQIHEEAFVAPMVFLSGDVRIAKHASIWPGVVARGDVNYISVGECSNVQDLTCLHVADDNPCIIGDYVTIGHAAVVHGCEIEDHVLIGMNATVLTGAKVGRGSIIAAGALVTENMVVPPNSLVVGVPGKIVRTKDVMKNIHAQAIKYKCEWAIGYGVKPDIEGEIYHGEKII